MLLLWLVVCGVGAAAVGPLFGQLSLNKPAQNMESNVARQVLTHESTYYNNVVAVIDDVDPDAAAPAVARARQQVAGIPGVQRVDRPMTAEDGTAVSLTVRLEHQADSSARKQVVDDVSDTLHRLSSAIPGSTVLVGGDEPQARQTNTVSGRDTLRAELVTLPVVLVLLALLFRGVRGATIPVLAAVVAIAASFAMVFVFSRFVTLDSTVLNVVSFLGLGLSIDYGLLLVARFREERAAGHAVIDAVERTWASAGRTVLFSGVIVSCSLAGLLAFSVPRLQTMGAAGVSATLVAMAASLTLPAAMLGLFGGKLRPAARPASEESLERGAFARLALVIQSRPALVTVLAAGLLVVLAAPAATMNPKLPQMAGLPRAQMESARAADVLEGKFGVQVQPSVVVVGRTDPATLDHWASRWADDPAQPHVHRAQAVGEDISTIALTTPGDTQSRSAQELVQRIRADRPPGSQSYVLGDAAVVLDLWHEVKQGLPLAMTVVLVAMLVILFLMTGSVVVPIKAVIMNILSLGATIGIMVAVFQHGVLAGPLDALVVGGMSPYILLLVSAFTFGFSMDYEVFLLTRIKEYVDRGHDTDTAVRLGLQGSGRVISAAAAVMLVVFAGFAMADLADVEELGLGLFIAILLDATVVRCVLVPATMTLLGRWNWWAPAFLRPVYRRLHLSHGPDVAAPPLPGVGARHVRRPAVR